MVRLSILLLAIALVCGCQSTRVGVEFGDPVHQTLQGTPITLEQVAEYDIVEVRFHLRSQNPDGSFRHPFLRVGGKFDLNQWDSGFWNDLEKTLKECDRRGIHATIEVLNRSEFKGKYKTSAKWFWGYAKNNNAGWVNSNYGDISNAMFATSGPTADTVKRLAAKLARVCDGYDVTILCCNEPEGGDERLEWHRMIVKALRGAGYDGDIAANVRADTSRENVRNLIRAGITVIEVHTTNIADVRKFAGWCGDDAELVITTDTGNAAFDLGGIVPLARECLKREVSFRWWLNTGDINEIKKRLRALGNLSE
jgi:hypothetical protein